jgi:hypothetical protein
MIRNIVQKAEQEFPPVPAGLADAPTDGDLYARKDGAWAEAASPTDVPLVPSFVYDGTAEATAFVVGDIPEDYAPSNTDITQLYLGNGVTTIGDDAFNGCSGLAGALVIPDSVTSIGSYAFSSNPLTSVTIGNSVTTIGGGAFSYNSLTSVTIGNSVTTIGNSAFAYNSLTSVTIPASVTSIGDYAFSTNALTSVTIGNSVTSIGLYAFAYNSLTSVTIPASVTSIGGGVFLSNSLATVILAEGRTTIPENFAYDANVGQGAGLAGALTIPNSVTSIGSIAFAYNSLTSVTIPNSVTSIGGNAFFNNSTLATVNCFITKTIIDAGEDIFASTADPLTINARASDGTWTAGTGLSIGGNTNVTVVKNL